MQRWGHRPQFCHPDRSGPGFPTSAAPPKATYAAFPESRTKCANATKLDGKYGAAQRRDLQFHSDRTQMPTSDQPTQPILLGTHAVPYKSTQSNLRNDNRRLKKRVSAARSDSAARDILFADDFGTTGGLSSPSRWSAVAGSFGLRRAKDSFTAVRCHTRSLSQNKQSA